MANFFDKLKDVVKKNIETDEKGFAFDFSKPEDPILDKEGLSPAQRSRREEFLHSINDGHQIPEEFQGLTRSQAMEDLERRVAERLSSLGDQEAEIQRIQEERERQRQELRLQSEHRRKRREKKKAEEAKMAPLVTDDAVIAVYKEPEIQPESELVVPVIETAVPTEPAPRGFLRRLTIPMEGQLTFRDMEVKTGEEGEEARAEAEPTAIAKAFDKVKSVLSEYWAKAKVRILAAYGAVSQKIFVKNPDKKEVLKEKKQSFSEKLQQVKQTFIDIKDTLIDSERRLSNNMVDLINKMDVRSDELAEKAEKAVRKNHIKFHQTREWIDNNKHKVLGGFAVVVTLVFIVIGAVNYMTAYEYAYKGKTLGLVKDQADVLKILDIVSEQLTKDRKAEILINKENDITFQRVWNIGAEIDDMDDVLRRLTYMQDMYVKGYGIYVEGKLIAMMESEAAAQQVLSSVMDMYAPQSEFTEYEDVDFAENIEILSIETKLGRISNTEDVIYQILTGAEEQKVHIVQAGETFSEIAQKYNMSQASLQASNPTVSPERLSIGQEIVLTQAVPLLTVQTVEVSTYTEYLPYDTIYEDNASIYIGETTTKKRGEDGERSVTAKIVRNNGTEVAKLELQSAITKEPVTAIVYKGTKELPPKKGTGSFIYPVSSYTLTSRYGPRWGRMHYGVDLAAPTGTKIRASDGGTVTFSGYQGSYGYVVKIDHGGGFVTVYAHCSKLLVKVGEQVYQGQHIANVGSTGNSTGPHCHFEIHYLGVQKNPLSYL